MHTDMHSVTRTDDSYSSPSSSSSATSRSPSSTSLISPSPSSRKSPSQTLTLNLTLALGPKPPTPLHRSSSEPNMSPTASKPNTPARMYAAGHGLEELDTPTRKKKSLFYTGDESESEVEFEKEEEEMSMKGEMEERDYYPTATPTTTTNAPSTVSATPTRPSTSTLPARVLYDPSSEPINHSSDSHAHEPLNRELKTEQSILGDGMIRTHIDHNNRDDTFLFHVPAPTISVDTSTATPTATIATTNTTTIPNDLEQDETDSITSTTRLPLPRTHTSPTALASTGSFPNLNPHIFPHLYTAIGNGRPSTSHTPSGAARVSFSQSLHNGDRPGSAHAHFSPLQGHGHGHTGHSHLGSAYNSAFNSTTTSARTSLTRIDALAMENPDSDMGRPLGEEEIARREEERQRMEQEGRERSERETGAEVQEEARPKATSADAPAPVTDSKTEPSLVPVAATESQAQVQITMEPKIPLTFLLITGARRSMSFDPETTVGRVKELIWGGWPEEFPASDKPPTPSYLRLLHLGKILQDEDTLTRLKFPSYTPSYSSPTAPPSTSATDPAPSAPSSPTSATSPSSLPIPAPMPLTIIHLSIRPHGPGIPPLSEDGNGLPKKKGMSIRRRSLFSGVQVPPLSLAVFNSNNNNGNGPTSPTSPSVGEAQSPTQGQGQGQVGVVGTTGLEGGVVASTVVSSAPAPPVDAGDEHGRSRGGGCCVIC